MRLVYLYGPPAVGKLTIARELAALTGFKLLHNHLTVNLAISLFPHGSEPYTRLVRQFRREMLAEAAQVGIDVVMTNVYLGTAEQFASIQRQIEPVTENGGSVLFVRLVCDREAWLARVPNESRRVEGKLLDPDGVIRIFKGGDPFATMPIEPRLTLDTTRLAPAEAAAQIATHYDLPLVGGAPRA
jgi:hypothetical protein